MLRKKEFDRFFEEVKQALAPIAKRYGGHIKLGNSYRYSPTNCTFTVQLIKGSGDSKPLEQVEFEMYCGMFGLTKDDYGRKFAFGGEQYTLCGFKPKAPKYPILARSKAGKLYKFPEDVLKSLA